MPKSEIVGREKLLGLRHLQRDQW